MSKEVKVSFMSRSTCSFGKMKRDLNFMILQTNLVIGSTNLIGIINQVHYMDNQFNLNFQPISLYVVYNFVIWTHIYNFTKSISWSV